MLSTHTRSSRVATCASELMPTKYLKSPTPRRYIRPPAARLMHWLLSLQALPCLSLRSRAGQIELGRDLLAPPGLHPGVDRLRIINDFAHIRVEAENAVGQTQGVERVAHH